MCLSHTQKDQWLLPVSSGFTAPLMAHNTAEWQHHVHTPLSCFSVTSTLFHAAHMVMAATRMKGRARCEKGSPTACMASWWESIVQACHRDENNTASHKQPHCTTPADVNLCVRRRRKSLHLQQFVNSPLRSRVLHSAKSPRSTEEWLFFMTLHWCNNM